MSKLPLYLSLAGALVLLPVLSLLGGLESGGPPHRDYELTGGIPATLYLPDAPGLSPWNSEPPEYDTRPPAVVLAHGFMSDRAGMSSLARALATAGYAALCIDLHGHGANRNAFTRPGGVDSFLVEDLGNAVQFLRYSPRVDGSRIVVMGHSMGASAALSYATLDPAIAGAILISGGREMMGAHRPPNALFIFAAGDPRGLRERIAKLAARVAGIGSAEPGRIYGDLRRGTAVRYIEVPGNDHMTIIFSSDAAGQMVAWLDQIFEIERAAPPGFEDPRLALAGIGALAFLLLLPGIASVAAGLAPKREDGEDCEDRGAAGGLAGLGILAASQLASLPFFAAGSAARPLLLEAGDVLAAYLGTSGLMVLVAQTLMGRFSAKRLASDLRDALLPAALAMIAIYLVLTPLSAGVHEMAPTPERMAVGVLYTLALLPFTLAFHHLLRRGGLGYSLGLSLAGRIVVLASIVVGVRLGIIANVIMLIVPVVAVLFVLFEVAATAIYARSRNVVLAALLEAAWLAWIMSASLPIRI
jgi:dienelactone hydrolase